MKKTTLIVGIVVAYSLTETSALLGILALPFGDLGRRRPEAIAAWAQLFLIPGLAALLSRITYGRYQWRRRALLILSLGSLFVPFLIAIAIAADALSDPNLSVSSPVILTVLLLAVLAGMVSAFFFAVRTAVRRGVRLETRRWFSDLESGVGPSERKWRNRGLRIAVCVPFMIVPVVSSFLPEICGILSHLTQPRAGSLAGYRIPIPFTWVISRSWSNAMSGESYVGGMAVKGPGSAVTPYLRADWPAAEWNVGTEPYYQSEAGSLIRGHISKDAEIIDRHDFLICDGELTCVEYLPPYLKGGNSEESIVFVHCGGSGRLHGDMIGKRNALPAFYEMINGITQTQ